MNIGIHHLSERPEWLRVVAGWIYYEWWTHVPDASPDYLAELLQPNLTSSSIPITLVAAIDECPIGTVSLLEHDVGTEPWIHLTPWLAALYVAPEHRRLGVGNRLLTAALDVACTLGVDVLYLVTINEEAFYGKRGWVPVDRLDERVVMSIAAGG